MIKKKQIEKFFVEWFIQKVGWDSCELFEGESPDFSIKLSDKIFGLEVTNLYKEEKAKGSLCKGTEEFKKKWHSKVSKKYYELSQIPLWVRVLTKVGELGGDPSELSYELFKKRNIEIFKHIEFSFNPTDKCKIKIFMDRLPPKFTKYNRWTFIDNHIGHSREIDEALIQKIIERKASKLKNYKNKYNDIILLIIVDRTFASGMFHCVTDKIVLPKCGFSSIYLGLYPDSYQQIL